ncbi:hypothetical protein GLYMA_05G127000v4 [Glycine max]|uniref:Uncharacterized protein n=1 Tax=Glycine max TaxID=3847 RepID=A0A0R0JUH2_SOYBN|nr:hypothetical protein JHK85_013146 [Glycine max]KRH58426.1 hypothetical protein GLYMA_05G127000v4 [Glycine max]
MSENHQSNPKVHLPTSSKPHLVVRHPHPKLSPTLVYTLLFLSHPPPILRSQTPTAISLKP